MAETTPLADKLFGPVKKELPPITADRSALEKYATCAHQAYLCREHNIAGGGKLAEALRTAIPKISVKLVDEKFSSTRARARFFQENPPRGIRRLIPRGLLTPERPYDDYVALILAEDYLHARGV